MSESMYRVKWEGKREQPLHTNRRFESEWGFPPHLSQRCYQDSKLGQRSPGRDAVQEPAQAARRPDTLASDSTASIISQHERPEKEIEGYSRRRVGRAVPVVELHPSIVAIRANINVDDLAFRDLAFEPKTNNVQLATARTSGKRCQVDLDKHEL
jgi:hypothetical protein